MSIVELLILNVIVLVLFCFLCLSAVEYFILHPWEFWALVAVFLIILFSYLKTEAEPSFFGFCIFLWGLFIFIGIVFISVKKVGQFFNAHPWIFWLGLGTIMGGFLTFLFLRSRKK